jgi:prevent-host-death family protein
MRQIFSAKDAKTRFGQLLEASSQSPVEITKNGRVFAYMVSAKTFMDMEKSAQNNDAFTLFSIGKIGSNAAVRMSGLRDYATFLVELGKKDLALPSLPDNEIERMKNTFTDLIKQQS